jgi:hypothetical protein
MQAETSGRRELLGRAVEHAGVISSLVARLDDGDRLSAAGRTELDGLRALLESGDASLEACAEAIRRLERLEHVLLLAVERCAASAHALADRLAVMEEFELHPARRRFSSRAASVAGTFDDINPPPAPARSRS